MRKVARALAALVLLVAVLTAAGHRHLAPAPTDCAICVHANPAGLAPPAPRITPPCAIAALGPVEHVIESDRTPRPLAVAPKHGPPARAVDRG